MTKATHFLNCDNYDQNLNGYLNTLQLCRYHPGVQVSQMMKQQSSLSLKIDIYGLCETLNLTQSVCAIQEQNKRKKKLIKMLVRPHLLYQVSGLILSSAYHTAILYAHVNYPTGGLTACPQLFISDSILSVLLPVFSMTLERLNLAIR